MATTLTIAGTDRTANIWGDTLKIEQAAGEFSAVCSFQLTDDGCTLDVQKGDAVIVAEDGTTLFGGEVTNVGTDWLSSTARRLTVQCQDYNILAEEAVIDADDGVSFSAQADSDIIAALFAAYRPDVDAVTHVSTLDASMTIAFGDETLRQALAEICGQTGGRWYVDEEKKLHYFTSEANVAAWHLSDSPDNATSFPYQEIKRDENATPIVNVLLVVGKGVRGWYGDVASAAEYGERPAVVVDQRLTTEAGLQARANALLDKWAWPRVSYQVLTRKAGLRAGMDVRLVCGAWSVDDTLTIRRLTIATRGGYAFYALELGDGVAQALTAGRVWLDKLDALSNVVLELDGTVYDTDPPGTPTFLVGNLSTGVDIDADGHQVVYIQATWGEVSDADLNHYDVQISTSADLSGYTITRSHPAGGDRIERFLPVLGNTLYYARVRAVDWVGNVSDWSAIRSITSAMDTSAPAQVVGVVAAGARTIMGLNWTANSEADLKEYEIARADDDGGSPGVYATVGTAQMNFYIDQDFTDEEIAAEATFWYRVRAIDSSGNAGDWSVAADGTLSLITGDHIAALTITAGHIAAGTITADKLNVSELSAITANLGTVTAGTVTGATIRTAASGARIVMDSTDGLQAFNASEDQTFSLQTSGAGYIGAAHEIAWNTAGGLTVDGGVLVDGTVVATAFSNVPFALPFDAANGLLLLGPYAALSTSAWVSSRSQAATISGAFHTAQGAWLGTRGLVIEEATTNYVLNPSGEVNTDNWTVANNATITRTTSTYLYGAAAFSVTLDGDTNGSIAYTMTAAATFVQNNAVTGSMWVKGTAGGTAVFGVQEHNAAGTYLATVDSETITFTGAWQRVTFSGTCSNAACSRVMMYLVENNTDQTVIVDGVQIEKKVCATSYCDGTLGSGYSWSGTAHASTSSRTVTTCSLTSHIALMTGNDTWSCRMVCQVRYDADGVWPATGRNIFWDARGSSDANRVFLSYNTTTDTFDVSINALTPIRISSAAQAFHAGDWVDLVVTLDFGSDSYKLYVNGAQAGDTCTTALTAPTVTGWRIGGNYGATNVPGITVAEYAVFDDVLTADEVAGLYVTNRPLVDAGALDKPGIYLYDGRFRLASSSTGARTEIDVDGIKAYTSGAQSVAIQPDGDAFFGSDISAAATTAIGVFANAQTYNSEAVGAGDVLFGDNSANKANMLWDKSAGQLLFRSGTTTQVYIDTTGALMAGGGAIKISSAANILFSVASANQGLSWFSNAGFSTVSGYINVATSTGIMTIATGGASWGTAPDMRFDLVQSTGTWTAIYLDASDAKIQLNECSTAASLAIRNNGDGAWPVIYAHQVSNAAAVLHLEQDHASAPVIRIDGGNSAYSSDRTKADWIRVNVDGYDGYLLFWTGPET